ncbi:MAG TPA: hypothetical protein VNM72_07265 [Blastocatellia bacterium]|nr:hypothetical protein [Blastocatellia bacterium]
MIPFFKNRRRIRPSPESPDGVALPTLPLGKGHGVVPLRSSARPSRGTSDSAEPIPRIAMLALAGEDLL